MVTRIRGEVVRKITVILVNYRSIRIYHWNKTDFQAHFPSFYVYCRNCRKMGFQVGFVPSIDSDRPVLYFTYLKGTLLITRTIVEYVWTCLP